MLPLRVRTLRTLLLALAVAPTAGVAAPPPPPQPAGPPVAVPAKPARPPNVIVVVADQWRAQSFGYAGDPNVKTPALDAFERQCVNFTQAVAGMPVCSPTRASLLTGRRPLGHGVFLNDVPLSDGAVTVAEVLRDAGYSTGCIGKWHLDGRGSRSAFIPPERRRGFGYWKVLDCTHDYNRSPYFGDDPVKRFWDGYDALAQTADACGHIRERAAAGKPFLLWLAWGPPHNPYETAPAKYRAMYRPEDIRLRPNVPPDREAAARRDLAGYYAHCTALDDCFALLLAAVRDAGAEDDTVIVFTSDHGDMLHSQGMSRKQKPFEESARVPMLIRVPARLGVKPHRTEAAFNSEDLMPTLLGLCGVRPPDSVEGLDFGGHLRGGPDPSGGATLLTCVSPFGEWSRKSGGREYRGVRTARHTYVRDLSGPWLLFDNVADPYQRENLVGRPEHAKLQAEMEELLRRKLAAAKDEFRPGDEYIRKWGYKVDASGTVPYKP
jgi:arylsulfatase A-like enzyme